MLRLEPTLELVTFDFLTELISISFSVGLFSLEGESAVCPRSPIGYAISSTLATLVLVRPPAFETTLIDFTVWPSRLPERMLGMSVTPPCISILLAWLSFSGSWILPVPN